MAKKSAAQIEEERRDIQAFELAKIACRMSESYGEALYIMRKAEGILKRQRNRQKPDAGEYPVDRYGQRVETPDAEASGVTV